MITKERLQELIDKETTIYMLDIFDNIEPYKLSKTMRIKNNSVYCMAENNLHFDIEEVYETKAAAEWVAKMHTQRTEKFEPPFELKDYDEYVFYTKMFGRTCIYNCGELEEPCFNVHDGEYYLSKNFNTYNEAVEYARKLFLGEEDE